MLYAQLHSALASHLSALLDTPGLYLIPSLPECSTQEVVRKLLRVIVLYITFRFVLYRLTGVQIFTSEKGGQLTVLNSSFLQISMRIFSSVTRRSPLHQYKTRSDMKLAVNYRYNVGTIRLFSDYAP